VIKIIVERNDMNPPQKNTASYHSVSPISQVSGSFKDRDYALVVRVISGHLIITSPDFQFPIPIVLPYNPPSIETGGKALIAAWLQIANYLKELTSRGEPHPSPKKPSEILPKLVDQISIREACRILGMKPDMIRDLVREGKIPCSRTPKGHRRFSRNSLHEYIKNQSLTLSQK
jgi:excisionase family DNA binding protein